MSNAIDQQPESLADIGVGQTQLAGVTPAETVADAASTLVRTKTGPAAGGPGGIATANTVAVSSSAPEVPSSSPVSAVVAPTSARGRSTVLPRVQVLGDVPELVSDARPRFEHGEVLGVGGLGEVVEARDQDIQRQVALKRMRPDTVCDETFVRFVDEIRTVGQLEHPNIVPIHDVGVDDDGQYFFVMKRLEGETLEAIIDRLAAGDPETHRRYTCERRMELFMGVLEAVQYAHTRGIIHRDIKPANIMVGPLGEVVVMDWGIAKQLGKEGSASKRLPAPSEASASPNSAAASDSARLGTTQAGALVGTPAYMSPEQAVGDVPVDERSDVYSLCVVLHELLCLHHYLADCETVGEVIRGVLADPVPHPSWIKNPYQDLVPSDLGWFVMAGLSKDPSERYESVTAMIDRLHRRADGEIPWQCPATIAKSLMYSSQRFIDRHPFITLAVLVAVPLSLLGLVAFAIVQLVA